MSNNHQFAIGRADLEFTLQFSKASDRSIHVYRDPPDIKKIAIAQGAGQISELKDVTALNYSNRSVIPEEGQVFCLENQHGNFACVQIHDVKDASRDDDRDEVTFSYAINPGGGTDFS
ncbi:MAG: hypothetical protein HRU33_21070 [Rhodobacteraceae bacterium]|nr:hypothetical protein [Paracoccaceae bacterium]